jgi:hypothetical protein
MSKITALTPKTYQGKPSGFTVTFEDGRNGNLEEKQSDKGLRVGDEVVVTEIPYTSKAGKQSTLYGVRLVQNSTAQSQQPSNQPPTPTPPPKPQIHVGTPKSIQELKTEAAIRCTGFMVECFIADKAEWAEIAEKQKILFNLVCGEIDDVFKG